MPEHNIQTYYVDRRERGMTDAMIANEMEASGWTLKDAQEAVQEARDLYVPTATSGFVQTQESVEYDVPPEYLQHSRMQGYYWILFMSFLTIGLVLADYVEYGFSFFVLLPLFLISGLSMVFIWKMNTAWQPRRIRIDAQGITVLVPHFKHIPWSHYESFSFNDLRHRGIFPRPDEPPLPIPSAPMIDLHIRGKQGWINDRERREDGLPYPPLQRERLETFMQQYLPLRIGPRPKVSYKSWKGVLAIVMFVLIVALSLFTVYLRLN